VTSGLLLIDALEIFEQVKNFINNLSENENSVLIKINVPTLFKKTKAC